MPDYVRSVINDSAETLPEWVPLEGEYCRRYFPSAEEAAAIVRSAVRGEAENRTTITINTAHVDGHDTIIKPKGGDLSPYKRNPVVLINHDRMLLAAESAVDLRGNKLVATVDDDTWDLDDPAISPWFGKLKRGLLKGASIGFIPTLTEWILKDKEQPDEWRNRRLIIKEWILREWSFVSVPSNAHTLVTQRDLQGAGIAIPVEFTRAVASLAGLSTKIDTILNYIAPESAADEGILPESASELEEQQRELTADVVEAESDNAGASKEEPALTEAAAPSPAVKPRRLIHATTLRDAAMGAQELRRAKTERLALQKLGKA